MKRDFTTLLAVLDGIPTVKETNVLLVGVIFQYVVFHRALLRAFVVNVVITRIDSVWMISPRTYY